MIDVLLALGLSEKEAKVYLATLKLGSATAAKIAKEAYLNRPTTYVILQKLAKLGLISLHTAEKVQLFIAESPERLDKILDNQKKRLAEVENRLLAGIPELNAMYKTDQRPRVVVYESPKAAEDYFYNSLISGEPLYSFTNLSRVRTEGGLSASNQRLRGNHPLEVVYTSDTGPRQQATNPREKRRAKFLPIEKFPFNSVITFAPKSGTIHLQDAKTNMNICIENSSLAESLVAIFRLIWSVI